MIPDSLGALTSFIPDSLGALTSRPRGERADDKVVELALAINSSVSSVSRSVFRSNLAWSTISKFIYKYPCVYYSSSGILNIGLIKSLTGKLFNYSNVSTTPVVFVRLTACWYLDTLEKLVSRPDKDYRCIRNVAVVKQFPVSDLIKPIFKHKC